jgi:conjugal transfer pilus assembly protein TraD
VVQGLVEIEERPNLVKLTKYIEGGIEPVLESSLRRYYDQTLGAGWRDLPEMKKLLNDAQRGNLKRPRRRPAPT